MRSAVLGLILAVASMAAHSSEPKQNNAAYVASLRAKFGSHIHFQSGMAAIAVQAFRIDCKAQDGRYLPLINVLYASLAEVNGHIDYYVQQAGDETRVVRVSPGQDDGTVMMTLDKWGELQTRYVEPIVNMCYGSHGPIWESTSAEKPTVPSAAPIAGQPTARTAAPNSQQFAVSLGTFDGSVEALEWENKLKAELGLPTYIQHPSDKYLLRMGPFDSRDDAMAAAAKVRAAGYGASSGHLPPHESITQGE